MTPLKFDISLTVLNHLGRNLYRSFATVLGEAISNAWDAEANKVNIYYEPDKRWMCVSDDGLGMTREDLQGKFLRIGYSKRDTLGIHSPNKGRHHIGRKGIGKLALLSCAEEVIILSKTKSSDWNGVIIDNRDIDKEIVRGSGAANYELKEPNIQEYAELCSSEQGTVICFKNLKEERNYSKEYLRKVIALYFRFSLKDPDFKIILNGEEVTIAALKDLVENTEFVWNINQYDADPLLAELKPTLPEVAVKSRYEEIRGFIASVKKPSNRNIFGAKERTGIDLFVNGRMRELDILKRSPSSQIPEEYLYGQIHIDILDSDATDRFTSSREGVQIDDPEYKKYLEEIKSIALKIMDEWNDLRELINEDGDPENTKKESSRTKKAKSHYREVAKEFKTESREADDFVRELANDGAFNSDSYLECFISENLLRRYIYENGLVPTQCSKIDSAGLSCVDHTSSNPRYNQCPYCKGESRRQNLATEKVILRISIPLRFRENDVLMYMDYADLALIIGNQILKKEDLPYKPLRNSVMHTSLLTVQAKTKLTSIFDNIVATVKQLV